MGGSQLVGSQSMGWPSAVGQRSGGQLHKSIENDQSPNCLSGSNAKGDVMNHVIKQINSLKLENLELKKMIGEKIKS